MWVATTTHTFNDKEGGIYFSDDGCGCACLLGCLAEMGCWAILISPLVNWTKCIIIWGCVQRGM